MKKIGIVLAAALAVLLAGCASTGGSPDDQAIAKGVHAWNSKGPASAEAYWKEIQDGATQKKYLGYIPAYNNGVKALEDSDAVNAKQEAKLLSLCNTALKNFKSLDEQLQLPGDVCDKGATLSAGRINKLLEAGKVTDAAKMHADAVKIYGSNADLDKAGKEVEVVKVISSKKSALASQAEKAAALEDFDQKIKAFDAVIAAYPAAEKEVNATVAGAGVEGESGVIANVKAFKNSKQNIVVKREEAIREKAYEYKDRIGEEFARQPAAGSNKDGSLTPYEIRDHYNSVKANIDVIYNELIAFSDQHKGVFPQSVLDDVKAQLDDLIAKIAQINAEIARKEQVERRGKTVMPLMIGLFNPQPGSTAESKKSRPAKFSATNQKKDEYWWGMVSIPKGKMNDLVITMKDNRTVRVFADDTGVKGVNKKELKNIVSMQNKVGNSWPVMNVGSQLKGSNYYFEVQPGKTPNYSGEVVVYSSFITRSR